MSRRPRRRLRPWPSVSTSARRSGATSRSSAWLPAYDRGDLRPDAIAGIVSWGVMVPVAMAYAGLAGMPPETGLVTAFAALAAYAVFGTSRHLKVTASSSVAIMSASVVGAIAAGNAEQLRPAERRAWRSWSGSSWSWPAPRGSGSCRSSWPPRW